MGAVWLIWTIAFLVVLPFLAVVKLCVRVDAAWDVNTSGLRRRRASDNDIGFSKVKLPAGGRLWPRGLRRRFVGSEQVPLSSPPGAGSGGRKFARSTRRRPRSGKIPPAHEYQADPETGIL